MKSGIRGIAAGTVLACLAIGAKAKEEQVPPSQGFMVHHTATIAAPVDTVYATLGRIGSWWDPAHTFSGDSRNMSLALKAGACFCEVWGKNSVEHMRVAAAVEGSTLRMTGGLGPLQGNAVGAMTIALKPEGAGKTQLDVTYNVWGHFPDGAGAMQGPVSLVLTQQFTRLKALIETGKADPAPAAKP